MIGFVNIHTLQLAWAEVPWSLVPSASVRRSDRRLRLERERGFDMMWQNQFFHFRMFGPKGCCRGGSGFMAGAASVVLGEAKHHTATYRHGLPNLR